MSPVFSIPNTITYVRLLLLLLVAAADAPRVVCALYLSACALDALDGWAARRLGLCSRYGAFLDVAVGACASTGLRQPGLSSRRADNAGRALMWTLSPAPALVRAWVPVLEGLTLAATTSGGAEWKAGLQRRAPPLVAWLLRDGFRTPQGGVLVAGLHCLPCALYLQGSGELGEWEGRAGWKALVAMLVVGRAAAVAIECRVLGGHFAGLLAADQQDAEAGGRKQSRTVVRKGR